MTGVNGEQYPVKPDIFQKTYEIVYDENELHDLYLQTLGVLLKSPSFLNYTSLCADMFSKACMLFYENDSTKIDYIFYNRQTGATTNAIALSLVFPDTKVIVFNQRLKHVIQDKFKQVEILTPKEAIRDIQSKKHYNTMYIFDGSIPLMDLLLSEEIRQILDSTKQYNIKLLIPIAME
ncbi:MAG: hypothetical protein N2043_01460 [Ignavibacterium sp.]|nr:hypothetical protein [Ignavibacterium sp.]